MIKLLIFDFDGTLCNTLPGIHTAINQVLIGRGKRTITPQEATHYIGAGLTELARLLGQENNMSEEVFIELIQEFRHHYQKVFLEQSFLYEGVEEFLKQWPHQVAIASNKSQHFLQELVKNTSLNQYKWTNVIGGDTLAQKKPHPLPLLHCLKTAGVQPHEALMVGDGLPDVEAAQQAKIRCVAVDFGYTPVRTLMARGATAQISGFDRLNATIELLSRG